jgi:hypothetical protein
LLKLKELELQSKQIESSTGIRFAELEAQSEAQEDADRASARSREIALHDPTTSRLAWTIIGGFIGISFMQFVALFFAPDTAKAIPPEGWLLIGNVSGYLAGEAKSCAAYYFGTTRSSATKDGTIAQLTANGG